jgi:hypothetical protein
LRTGPRQHSEGHRQSRDSSSFGTNARPWSRPGASFRRPTRTGCPFTVG